MNTIHRTLYWLPGLALLIACAPPSEEVQAILDLEAVAAEGRAPYEDHCATCHDIDGTGILGPDIRYFGQREVVQVLLDPPQAMERELRDVDLEDQQIADIAAYVETTL